MKNNFTVFVRSKRIIIPAIAILAVAIGSLVFTPSTSFAQKKKATITIANNSDYDIHHLFLAPVHSNSWGPDQLGDHVIESGKSFTLQNIPCDDYDIKLVDDEGDECVVEDVELCKSDNIWKVTNRELEKCTGWGK